MGVPLHQQTADDGHIAAPPSATTPLRVRMEAVQTVTPWKAAAEGRVPRQILAASRDAELSALQCRIRMVLFYDKPLDDGNGWKLAGKFKESLNIALSEEPVIAGRLRRRVHVEKGASDSSGGGSGDGGVGYQVKYTDSGVRLAQARAEGGMSAFMKAAARADVQRLLTYSKEIDDERDIEYSPLFFVQLTVFEGEGFAVGVNASLLVSDPLLVANFLRTWSRIHNKMQTTGTFREQSIFHLSNFRRADAPPDFIDDLVAVEGIPDGHCPYQTLMLRQSAEESIPAGGNGQKPPTSSLATLLTSRIPGTDSFYLFDNGSDGATLKVDGSCGSEGFLQDKSATSASCFLPVSADEALGGFEDVAFEGSRPIHVSFAVDSGCTRAVIAVLGAAAVLEDNAGPVPGAAATLLSFTAPAAVEALAKA